MNRNRLLGISLAIPTILVWGTTFVSTKALLNDFSAFEILLIRYSIAYIALWILCPKRLRLPSPRDELLYLLAGFFGVTSYQLLENCAIHFTNATNVSILVSICPIITALFSHFVYHEKVLTKRFFLGFLLAISGVCLVCLNGSTHFSFQPIGDAMALGAALCWSCYSTVLTRINSKHHHPLASSRRIFFWSLLFMLPLLVIGARTSPSTLHGSLHVSLQLARFHSPTNLFNLAFLGFAASAMCFVFWNRACQLLGTVTTTIGIYCIPLVTALIAFAFLHETLSPMGSIGAALTLAGVFLSTPKHS